MAFQRLMPLLVLGGTLAFSASLPDGLDWTGNSSLYPALQRISARSGLSLPYQGWPLSSTKIREFLKRAVERNALTGADSLAFSEFLDAPRELKRWTRMDDRTFLAIEPRVEGSVRCDSSLTRRLGSLGGQAYGSLNDQVQFFSRASISTEWADRDIYYDRYQDPDGEPSEVPLDASNTTGLYSKRTFARYISWVQWQGTWLTAKYGRDALQHGPGEWTGLTTSRFAAPNTFFDFRIDPFPWLTVQTTTSKLLPSDLQGGSALPTWFSGDSRKWMHVHRYEIRPAEGFALAFQDQVVYSDSGGLQPEYLLPLVPIFFTQDVEGNGPNAAMQFDLRVDRIPFTSLWGAFLIDDLDGPTTILNDHWLNRWAALVGMRLVSPWRGLDADLTAEISVVRPWTFTEERTNGSTFSSYGLPLGTEGGPDSRSLHFRFLWRPFPSLELGTEYNQQEKGIGRQAVLGTIHDESVDGAYSKLLVHSWSTRTASARVGWEPWFGKSLTGSVGYAWSDSSKYRGLRWSAAASSGW